MEIRLEAAALERLGHPSQTPLSRPRAPSCSTRASPVERVQVVRRVHLRYKGTDTAIPVVLAGIDAMTTAFEASHRATYSFP